MQLIELYAAYNLSQKSDSRPSATGVFHVTMILTEFQHQIRIGVGFINYSVLAFCSAPLIIVLN